MRIPKDSLPSYPTSAELFIVSTCQLLEMRDFFLALGKLVVETAVAKGTLAGLGKLSMQEDLLGPKG